MQLFTHLKHGDNFKPARFWTRFFEHENPREMMSTCASESQTNFLPNAFLNSELTMIGPNTFSVDADLGDMFLNFPLENLLQ